MVHIDRFDPFTVPVEARTPLARLTKGFEHHQPLEINQSNIDWLAQDNLSLQTEFSEYLGRFNEAKEAELRGAEFSYPNKIFTWQTRTLPLDFDSLLSILPEEVDPSELVYRQHILAYPARGFYKGTYGYDGDLTGEAAKVLYDRGFTSSVVDESANNFLALQLVKNPRMRSLDPWTFVDLVKPEGLTVDFRALWDGMVTLTERPMLERLISRGLVDNSSLKTFYQGVADRTLWVTQYRLANEYAPSTEVPQVFPYPLSQDQTDIFPRIDYLPCIGSTLLEFIRDVPYFITDGKYFQHNLLSAAVRRYFRLVQDVLTDHVREHLGGTTGSFEDLARRLTEQNPREAQKVRAVAEQVNGLVPSYERLFRVYEREPGLLNRSQPKGLTPANFPRYNEIRNQILDAGGRAPKKPLAIQVKHSTKKGNI